MLTLSPSPQGLQHPQHPACPSAGSQQACTSREPLTFKDVAVCFSKRTRTRDQHPLLGGPCIKMGWWRVCPREYQLSKPERLPLDLCPKITSKPILLKNRVVLHFCFRKLISEHPILGDRHGNSATFSTRPTYTIMLVSLHPSKASSIPLVSLGFLHMLDSELKLCLTAAP